MIETLVAGIVIVTLGTLLYIIYKIIDDEQYDDYTESDDE